MVPADDSMPNVYEEPDPEHDDTMSNDAGVDVGTISDGSAGLVSPQCKKTAIKLVAVSLLIDALLLTIVVSTGTKFLVFVKSWPSATQLQRVPSCRICAPSHSLVPILPYSVPKTDSVNDHQSWKIGVLFASKAVVQIIVNPIVGIGSACIATSGFALLALVNPDDEARGEAIGMATGGLALGVLVGPPLGGFLYHIADKWKEKKQKHHNATASDAMYDHPYPHPHTAIEAGYDASSTNNLLHFSSSASASATGGVGVGNSTGGASDAGGISGVVLPFAVVAVLTLCVAVYQMLWFRKHAHVMKTLVREQQRLAGTADNSDNALGHGNVAPASVNSLETTPLVENTSGDGTGTAAAGLQPQPPKRCNRKKSLRALLADKVILTTLGAYTLANASIGMLEPTLPLWMQDAYESPSWLAGVLFLAPSFSFLLTAPLIAGWAHKVGRARCAMFGMLLIAASLVLMTTPGHRDNPAEAIPGLVGVGVGIGICEATVNPLIAAVVETRYPGNFGSAFALSDMAFSLGFVIGPILGTSIYSVGATPPLSNSSTAPNYANASSIDSTSPTVRFGDACMALATMLVLYSPIMYWCTVKYDGKGAEPGEDGPEAEGEFVMGISKAQHQAGCNVQFAKPKPEKEAEASEREGTDAETQASGLPSSAATGSTSWNAAASDDRSKGYKHATADMEVDQHPAVRQAVTRDGILAAAVAAQFKN
eukprot:gene18167-13809_t